MVVSLTSSLTGVVRRKEVSDQFCIQAAASEAQEHDFARKKRGRYFQDDTAGRIPLTDLFRTGQVIYCIMLLYFTRHDYDCRADFLAVGCSSCTLRDAEGMHAFIQAVLDVECIEDTASEICY